MSRLMSRLLYWLSRRRLSTLHVLGAVLGWGAWALSPSYRARLGDNARRAGIALADRRRAVAEAGRMSAEMPRLWLRPAGQPIADPLRWEGVHWIEAALGRPGGLVILTPHLGSFEVAAQAYAERFGATQPMTVLYRPARQPWLRRLEEQARARPGLSTAPASLAGVRSLLRALQRGHTVGLLPDQVPPQGQGVWAPFFGQPAYTMTLAARLARQTGATVLQAWCERLPRGAGYVVRVEPLAHPLPLETGLPAPAAGAGDGAGAGTAGVPAATEAAWAEAAATAINRSMEALILRHPAQYLWGYHRYKAPRPTP